MSTSTPCLAPDQGEYHAIKRLPRGWAERVSHSLLDYNGHMNVAHYMRMAGEGLAARLDGLGLDADYRATDRASVFAAQHHLEYRVELVVDAGVSVHVQVVDRSVKALHMIAYLIDDTHRRLACTLEALLLHVDLDRRSATPCPRELAEMIDGAIEQDLHLIPMLSGTIGIRRTSGTQSV